MMKGSYVCGGDTLGTACDVKHGDVESNFFDGPLEYNTVSNTVFSIE